MTSQKTVDFELDGEVKTLPMPALINLYYHPNEDVRKRAYAAEFEAWESIKEPLAASMNGVKGWVNTLNQHRGRVDALHAPIDQARIDRETLDVMLEAMRESFPTFRRYFKAKAARWKHSAALVEPVCAGWKTGTDLHLAEAADFIQANFEKFSPDLKTFAKTAL